MCICVFVHVDRDPWERNVSIGWERSHIISLSLSLFQYPKRAKDLEAKIYRSTLIQEIGLEKFSSLCSLRMSSLILLLCVFVCSEGAGRALRGRSPAKKERKKVQYKYYISIEQKPFRFKDCQEFDISVASGFEDKKPEAAA